MFDGQKQTEAAKDNQASSFQRCGSKGAARCSKAGAKSRMYLHRRFCVAAAPATSSNAALASSSIAVANQVLRGGSFFGNSSSAPAAAHRRKTHAWSCQVCT